jgi:hypothetical protein
MIERGSLSDVVDKKGSLSSSTAEVESEESKEMRRRRRTCNKLEVVF